MNFDEEIKEEIKKEAKLGIAQIIAKIFATILEPILKLIDLFKSECKRWYDDYKMKKTMNFIVNSEVLRHYLDKHNFDCIMFNTHNGQHSESGFGYKYVKSIFHYVQSKNNMLEIWCNNSSPIEIYLKWMYHCLYAKSFLKCEFDEKMQLYFADYDKIFWRKYKSVFYCIMSGDAILTESHEKYINKIIDNFLYR